MNDPFSILVCLPVGRPLLDPLPEATASRDVDLVSDLRPDTNGVVGWSTGGWTALKTAVEDPALPRLVLVSLPYPEQDPDSLDLDDVTAKTLLLFGSADAQTGSSHGRQWQARLPNARLEMVPGGGHDVLAQMWPRILSHLAPRRTRP